MKKETYGQRMAAFEREQDERDWRLGFREVIESKEAFPKGSPERQECMDELTRLIHEALYEEYEIPPTSDEDVFNILRSIVE